MPAEGVCYLEGEGGVILPGGRGGEGREGEGEKADSYSDEGCCQFNLIILSYTCGIIPVFEDVTTRSQVTPQLVFASRTHLKPVAGPHLPYSRVGVRCNCRGRYTTWFIVCFSRKLGK